MAWTNILANHTARCGPEQAEFQIPIKSGVFQGSIVSPYEFNFFINDIALDNPEHCVNIREDPPYEVSNVAYADDLSLLSNDHEQHQAHLNHVANWARDHQMEFNATKSMNIIIPRLTNPPAFTLDGTTIPRVASTKIIGINLSEKGILERKSGPHNALTAAQSWHQIKHKVPANTLIPIYYCFVTSSALYGCEVARTDPHLAVRCNRFLKQSLSIPRHSVNAIAYEFTGTYRPDTIIMKRRLRFIVKACQSTVPTIRASVEQAIQANSDWWSAAYADAARLNMTPAFRHLEEARRELRHADPIDPTPDFDNQCKEFLSQVKTRIDQHEREWFDLKLTYLNHICKPGKGSYIFRKATAPGAHTVILLRYDLNDHLRRHEGLETLDFDCTLCTGGPPESNLHVLFECRANRLDPSAKKRFMEARTLITDFYDENTPKDRFLDQLTGPLPKDRNGNKLSLRDINLITTASVTIQKTRATMYLRTYRSNPRLNAPESTRQPHMMTPQERIQICTQLQRLTDPNLFTATAHRATSTLKKKHWREAWKTAAQATGLDPQISAQLYYSFLITLHELGPLLCTASPKRRQDHEVVILQRESTPDSRHGAKLRYQTLKNTALKIPWAATLPLWNWISSTPLASAWALEPRPHLLPGKHHELLGLDGPSMRTKQSTQDLYYDLSAAMNSPTPEIPTTFGGDHYHALPKNTRNAILRKMTLTSPWHIHRKHERTPTWIRPNAEHLRPHAANIRHHTCAQMSTDTANAFALAIQWFREMIAPPQQPSE